VGGRSVDGPAKEQNEFDDAVAVVEKQDCEDLVVRLVESDMIVAP
jgi:hypothetical protein